MLAWKDWIKSDMKRLIHSWSWRISAICRIDLCVAFLFAVHDYLLLRFIVERCVFSLIRSLFKIVEDQWGIFHERANNAAVKTNEIAWKGTCPLKRPEKVLSLRCFGSDLINMVISFEMITDRNTKDSIWWDPIETDSIQDYRGEIPRRPFEACMELLALRGVNLEERFSRDQLLIWFTANRRWLYCDGRITSKIRVSSAYLAWLFVFFL